MSNFINFEITEAFQIIILHVMEIGYKNINWKYKITFIFSKE